MARKRKHPVTESLPLSLPKDFDSESALSSPDSQSSGKQEKHPLVRSAANARERSRMRVLSKAFSRLKTTLPWVPADTKLSKLDTLRLAACYIAHLRDILAEDKAEQHVKVEKKTDISKANTSTKASSPAPIHPLNLTWPFTFNNRAPTSGGPVFPGSKDQHSHQLQNSKTEISST